MLIRLLGRGFSACVTHFYCKKASLEKLSVVGFCVTNSRMCISGTNANECIDLSSFPVLYRHENVILHDTFKRNGYELRIAGGAVRDILLGMSPHDIDYATNATPSDMHEMFTKEGFRTLNRNGEAHGTVTVRINDKENFEITTLRIDSQTDGRHSVVVFTNDWKLDAERRDLTVNSMFLSVDLTDIPTNLADQSETSPNSRFKVTGRIIDYFDGQADLKARRIRFVGNTDKRIKEDYLRILRYFRFHGRLSNKECADQHDEATLKTIAENAHGLASITGERCWNELKKILLFSSTPALIRRIYETGLFPKLGLPTPAKFERLEQLWNKNILMHPINPVTPLAALLSTEDEIETLHNRLKFSNHELGILAYIVSKRDQFIELISGTNMDAYQQELKLYQREYILSTEPPNKVKAILTEMLYYLGRDPELIKSWLEWIPPKFPVNGFMLKENWCLPSGKLISTVLYKLRTQWVDSNYQLTADELLSTTNKSVVMEYVTSTDVSQPSLPIHSKKRKR